MKRTIPGFCFLLFLVFDTVVISAQIECDYQDVGATLVSNNMAVRINSDGTLFHRDGEGYFKSPYIDENSPTSFRKAGIWIGGYEAGTNNTVLKFAASAANNDDDRNDFVPGPLFGEYGDPYPCNYMNKVWSVTKEDIEAHIKDWNEDKIIDAPILSVISWPGNGNKNCCLWEWGVGEFGLPDTQHGWAPFHDRNWDGIYDPFDGDYPSLGYNEYLPNEIYWTVYNDLKWEGHELSGGARMGVEVHLTAYTMSCESNYWVEDFLFTEYKIINKGWFDIDSMYMGIWVDFDIGCPEDDYIGSIPQRNAIYAYNADPVDGDSTGACVSGETSYGEHPPVASVTFLPHRLGDTEFVGASYFSSSDSIWMGQQTPQTTDEFYGYLNGRWRDGTPITIGGNGYDPGGTGEISKFVYPDLPSDDNGWSMYTEGIPFSDYDIVGIIRPNDWRYDRGLRRNGSLEFSVAYGHHHPRGRDHLSIVDRIENWELNAVEYAPSEFYSFDQPFCFHPGYKEAETTKGLFPSISIFPNPVYNDKATIEYTGKEVYQVAIFDVNKNLSHLDIDVEDTGKVELDFSNYQKGIYFIRLIIDGVLFEERIVVF